MIALNSLLLAALAVVLPAVGAANSYSGGSVSARPQYNLIIITADDLGREWLGEEMWADSGAYPANTPTFDALIAGGVVLDNFWAGLACACFRVNLLTGRYSFRHGTRFGSGIFNVGEFSVFEGLQQRGYATALFGPAPSLETRRGVDYPVTPTAEELNDAEELYGKAGFDYFFYGHHGGASAYSWSATLSVTPYGDSGSWYHLPDSPTAQAETFTATKYIEDALRDGMTVAGGDPVDALGLLGWLAERRATEPTRPWAVWYASPLPHFPREAPPGGSCTDDLSCYREMVEYLDTSIGLIKASLTAAEWSRTLLIFSSDNGAETTISSPGGKFSELEWGTNVGAIIYGGPLDDSLHGTHLTGLYTVTDLLPTMLDIAGTLKTPTVHPDDPYYRRFYGQTRIQDGVSLRGRLFGDGSVVNSHDYLWANASTQSDSTAWTDGPWSVKFVVPAAYKRTVRGSTAGTAGYKLVRTADGTRDALYYLPTDPLQATDLNDGSMTGAESTALAELQAWLSTTEATEPAVWQP